MHSLFEVTLRDVKNPKPQILKKNIRDISGHIQDTYHQNSLFSTTYCWFYLLASIMILQNNVRSTFRNRIINDIQLLRNKNTLWTLTAGCDDCSK